MHMSNGNKNTIYVEAKVMNNSAKFQLHTLMASEEKIFFFFFLANLAFRLPCQSIKFSGLDKIHIVGRELLKEHFCKTFVKMSSVRQQEMPISTVSFISQ